MTYKYLALNPKARDLADCLEQVQGGEMQGKIHLISRINDESVLVVVKVLYLSPFTYGQWREKWGRDL